MMTADKSNPVTRFMASIIGALGEAWAELRTHKLRVLLSLIGIGVAVAALTSVLALGEYQRQAMIEQSDRYSGRLATLHVTAHRTDNAPVDWADMDRRFVAANERLNVSRTSRVVEHQLQLPVQLPDGVTEIPAKLVDPAYPILHRSTLLDGSWFRSDDRDRLAPAVVISEPLWETLGSVPLDQHPTLSMTGNLTGEYIIIGITPREGPWDNTPAVTMLLDDYVERNGSLPGTLQVIRELWVTEEAVAEIAPVLAMDLRSGLPAGLEVSVTRNDWGSGSDMEQSVALTKLITGSIAGIVLLLGGLSLVNVQLVAMRQRIREIGVRRSFGATGGRIFTAVMLESVVATTVAGLAGIVLAVAILRSPFVLTSIFPGIQDPPAFPLDAAVTGLLAAVIIGALAGLIPALIALRVKVIDAIRF